MRSEVSPGSPTKRASWMVRVTQTNQHNWILLLVVGSATAIVGVLGLIAGNVPGGLFVLFFGAVTAGPSAWWVRRATRMPVEGMQPEPTQESPEEPGS